MFEGFPSQIKGATWLEFKCLFWEARFKLLTAGILLQCLAVVQLLLNCGRCYTA